MAYEIPGFVYSETWDGVAATIPQFSAVRVGAATIAVAGAAGAIDGIVQMPCIINAAETVRVMKSGISFAVAGVAGVTKGQGLEVAAAGNGTVATLAAGVRIGTCLQTAAAGGLTTILLD